MPPRVGRPASPTPCLLLVAAGLPNGLGYGVLAGPVSIQVPRLLDAALARLPATMVVAAVAVLLFGPSLGRKPGGGR
jgi:putative exporter of polyketide antibiotics